MFHVEHCMCDVLQVRVQGRMRRCRAGVRGKGIKGRKASKELGLPILYSRLPSNTRISTRRLARISALFFGFGFTISQLE